MNRNTGAKATRIFCSSRPKFGRRDTRKTTLALLATRPARPSPKHEGRESFPQFRGSYLYGLLVKPEFRNSNERRGKPGVAKTPKRAASKSFLVLGILFHRFDVVTQRSDDYRRLRGRMYCLRYGRFASCS